LEHEDSHETLIEPLEIARSLRDHAIKHYGQAKANLFGTREVFDKLTEDPMKNPFYDEILNGMLEHQHELSASQKLFGKHLRSKVSADLAPEAEKLAEPMTLIEWRKFFLKAKEGTTTSLVSGLHRGHYKTCATNDIIATIKTTIVSLAFEFVLKGVHRWQNYVYYILEKGKGPFLGKLCTIKLLECDLNFGLKWDFTWRLGKFADKHQLYNQNQHALPGKWCHSPALNKTLTFDLMMQTHLDGSFGDYDTIP
jgi:hypothetical protein